MKVGDLVRVYDFSHVARERLVSRLNWDGAAAQFVGLIVATYDSDPKHRKVLRCVDGESEHYNVNRLEVSNAGR